MVKIACAFKSALIAEGLNTYDKCKLHLCVNDTNDYVTNTSITDARLTIRPDGNVGLANTNPTYKLDVSGNFIQILLLILIMHYQTKNL